jgi:hypothetical protein
MTKWITATIVCIVIAIALLFVYAERTPVDRQAYFRSANQFDSEGWVMFLGEVPLAATRVIVLYDLQFLREVDRVDLTGVFGREFVKEVAISADGRHAWVLAAQKLALFSLHKDRDPPISLVGTTSGRFSRPLAVIDDGVRLGIEDEEARTGESIVDIRPDHRPDGQVVLLQSLWRDNASTGFFRRTVAGFRQMDFFLIDDHRMLELPWSGMGKGHRYGVIDGHPTAGWLFSDWRLHDGPDSVLWTEGPDQMQHYLGTGESAFWDSEGTGYAIVPPFRLVRLSANGRSRALVWQPEDNRASPGDIDGPALSQNRRFAVFVHRLEINGLLQHHLVVFDLQGHRVATRPIRGLLPIDLAVTAVEQ